MIGLSREMSRENSRPRDSQQRLETSVWDVEGTVPGGIFFRFGGKTDQAMFRIMRVLAFIDCVWIPFLVSFARLSWVWPFVLQPPIVIIDTMASVLYTAGVLMQLRTSVISIVAAQEFLNPAEILAFRIRSLPFWLDCVSLLGTLWWHPGLPFWWAGLRLCRAWRITESADDLYVLHLTKITRDNWVKKAARMTLELALVIHCFACTWVFCVSMSQGQLTFESNLAKNARFVDFRLRMLYLTFFADGARMLAGWGRPDPIDAGGVYCEMECLALSIMTPSSAIYGANVFAQILSVVEQAEKPTAKHLGPLGELSTVLDSLLVPASLKRYCLHFHSFLTTHHANQDEYDDLFKSMAVGLQHELKVHLFDELLQTVYYLQGIPKYVRISLAIIFDEAVFGPGLIIFRKGDPNDGVFVMMKGSAELVLDDVVITVLQIGQTFGETALLTDGERLVMARAKTFCRCAKMHRATFLEVMNTEPEIKEIILRRIADPNLTHVPRAREVPEPEERARQSMLCRKMLLELHQNSTNSPEAALAHKFRKATADVGRMCSSLEKLQEQFDNAEARLGSLEKRIF